MQRAPTPELKKDGEGVKAAIDVAFKRAMDAYSNAKGGEEKEDENGENAEDSEED